MPNSPVTSSLLVLSSKEKSTKVALSTLGEKQTIRSDLLLCVLYEYIGDGSVVWPMGSTFDLRKVIWFVRYLVLATFGTSNAFQQGAPILVITMGTSTKGLKYSKGSKMNRKIQNNGEEALKSKKR